LRLIFLIQMGISGRVF